MLKPECLSVDAVYADLDRYVEKRLLRSPQGVSVVYAGEDAALLTFVAAGTLGMKRIYDLPTIHHREMGALLHEEMERLPEFASTLLGVDDSDVKRERKDGEMENADIILACSQHVARSLLKWGIAESKIRVMHYGAPEVVAVRKWTKEESRKPLRVLFVGAIGQRKGVGDLLAAIQTLNSPQIQLVMMGSMLGSDEVFRRWRHWFQYEVPRPHSAVLDLMRSCDVLVLPSIADGFGLVVSEAMACGLPVIVTPNTGASDYVTDGVDGFIVPIRSSDAIATRLDQLASDREKLAEMGQAAVQKARSWSWRNYREEILDQLGLRNETRPTRAPISL